MESKILGFMNSPNDRDLYAFNLQRSAIVDIQVSGVKGINLSMKIWKGDTDPKLIKWIDDNRKSSFERFPNLLVEPGKYYVEITQSDRDARKANTETPYELTVKSREPIAEESEPNDSRGEANKIHPDKEISGYFSPAYNRLNTDKDNLHREEDWYVVEVGLKSDSPVLMDVTLSGVSEINSVVYLYDADGKELAMADNGGAGEPEAITGVGIQKSGVYYIMVASKSYSANSDEPYTLQMKISEPDLGMEMEKNNDFDTANKIVNNFISGKINARDDRDFFFYQAGGPNVYRIELRPPEDMDVMFSLYNSDKEKIMDINNSGRGKKEIHPDFYAEKDFYIAISAKAVNELPRGEYLLSIVPFKGIENLEREPNNDLSQANRITGRVMKGYISSKGDKDYYLVASDARFRERFEIRGVKGGEIKVSVTDSMGYIIKSFDVKSDRKITFTEMFDKKGYIVIEGTAEAYDNPYTITRAGGQ